MTQQETDERYMRRCLQLAAQGRNLSRPNPMVGAVIVYPNPSGNDPSAGIIIGEGYHARCGEGHAEVNAFASVKPRHECLLHASTIYVSLEPCAHYGRTPPCCDLIIKKGVRRVVVGCVDPFAKVQGRGIERIRQAGIEVTVGVLERECQWLNRRFFTFHSLHRPYIILKWAQLSNSTGQAVIDDDGRPTAISTPFTKMLVHRLRAHEDAILVGHTTYEREHPQLNVRLWAGPSPEPLVVSRTHPEFMTIDAVIAHCMEGNLQSVVVEGGRQTLESFIQRDLWDELRIEIAPRSVVKGTPAPSLPAGAEEFAREEWDGNVVRHLRRRVPAFLPAKLSYHSLCHMLRQRYDAGEASAIVRLVLEERFQLSTAAMLTGGVEQLSATDQLQLRLMVQRMVAGEPVQYVLGEARFCGRQFRVAPGVLIPRPETEELCRWVLESHAHPLRVLDVGTGSGCIICTLAAEYQSKPLSPETPHAAQFVGCDISETALAIARENARRTQVAVKFRKQDALEMPAHEYRWDLIVSNPPYICFSEQAEMEQHVLDHEPHQALFVPNDDALCFYRSIAHYARKALVPGGSLYFELNPRYAQELAELLQAEGFENVELKTDQFGKCRFARAQRGATLNDK